MNRMIIDDRLEEAFYIQIYRYYKNQIIHGIFKEGDKLPSIRQLTKDIKVSKTTVETAYNQLVVEGYVNNIPKRGYYVVQIEEQQFNFDGSKTPQGTKENKKRYINIGVDKNSFDIKLWKRLYGNTLLEKSQELFTSGDGQGEIGLRENICEFVKKTRGVRCNPQQIIVGAGVQQLLGNICVLLGGELYLVALEYPGFNQAKTVFENYGLQTKAIPVYNDGMNMEVLKTVGAKMVYVSPSHQYPTGSVMPIQKRMELLKWAKENDSIIIEDDYDCLIRYESRPIPALQGLDKGNQVIYLGSFSKLLLPSIRISYMILPDNILKRYLKDKKDYSQTASKIEQLTLAKFMEEGHFERHIRRIKKAYYKKNEKIVNYLHRNGNNKIKILGHDSGLHMMLEIETNKNVEEIIREAENSNIFLELVEGYQTEKIMVVFTYSGIDEGNIESVLKGLLRIIN